MLDHGPRVYDHGWQRIVRISLIETPFTRPKRTIGAKLNRLVLLSVSAAMLIGAALSAWGAAQNFLEAKRATMLATADVFAAATARAVAKEDAAAVAQAIRAIARIPGFVYADVRGRNGMSLAEIGEGTKLSTDLNLTRTEALSPLALFATRTLSIVAPIIEGGETVGEIELMSSAVGLTDQLATTLVRALVGSIVALGVGLTFALRLRRSITRPIETLAVAMDAVERSGDYTTSVAITSNDETALLARSFNSMMAEVRAATDRILDREKEIIERLGKAGEMRDDQTGQHVVRFARISRIIASHIGLPKTFVDDLCRASPMHDVGKISISDAILHKPGRLDADERREMEEHARRGFEILEGSKSDLVQLAAEIAIPHHERWDGQGYPNKLAGERIPLSGRITAVADVCDALLSERPYKQPWSFEDVYAFLLKEAGNHFDPACVSALLAHWAALQAIYSREGALPRAA